ncbi:uncharacterized protein EAF01_000962 [Botrytis porri]|uniref:uncharacterized protein n=1 Tax=Botrytis porri TaxID=87229 RepID=UPI0019016196|nr:uncharacterized protein EAF01_000962 [Botrytis porri]KAF7914556.1 hypothetical protein EAF01_000962 [Botrytis porri]
MRGYHHACLLPYINLKGLTENPVMFLSLLQNRTQYSSEQWAPMIISFLKNIGTWALWLSITTVDICRVSKSYPDSRAQTHLLSFLRSTVEQILGSTTGYPMKSQISSFNKVYSFGSTTLNGQFDSIPGAASCYLYQLFSAPAIFDIDHLLNIAKTRQALQGDHLRFL